MDKETVRKLRERLSRPGRIVLVPHSNPDGDAIGSCLGLHHYLTKAGHQSNVISPNDFPSFLKWMPGAGSITIFERDAAAGRELLRAADLIITLDFNSLDRCGAMGPELKETGVALAMIDHHQSPEAYAEIRYSDPAMSSTCEMVYHTIAALGGNEVLDEEIATCLYAGILTDTGSFKYSATSPTTMRIAAELMERGADHTAIHRNIYDTNSPERLKLLGQALGNLTILRPYRTAYITLSQQELDACQFQKGDTEGFVNYGLSLEGVVLSAIFIENKEEGIIKISLRSQGTFSVNDMARAHFSGGGHVNAAGGRSTDSLQATAARFEALLPQYERELLLA